GRPGGGTRAPTAAIELPGAVGGWTRPPANLIAIDARAPAGVTNTQALGQVLYTKYLLFFQASGLVLLTAMIGAIVLTLRHKVVKRQSVEAQNARTPETAVELKKVASRAGV
ncbi:MAG TPA: NADH-quinone oxidoreductase subunit J, partial [Rhodoblastus sp.]|nr:NADH-quinone oxidoreductase subunit J [Rhodoblastus sp.]